MKISVPIVTFLVSCLLTLPAHGGDLSLKEEIKYSKPLVCEVISVELSEVSDRPVIIINKIPSEWKRQSGFKISVNYVDKNKITVPSIGIFAFKNRYWPDESMDFQYAIYRTEGYENRLDAGGELRVFIGDWLVIPNRPDLLSGESKSQKSTLDLGAIAIRFSGQ
jgi:hypothetical protein